MLQVSFYLVHGVVSYGERPSGSTFLYPLPKTLPGESPDPPSRAWLKASRLKRLGANRCRVS